MSTHNNNCGCEEYTTPCSEDPCTSQTGCPIPPTDASCIYYNLLNTQGLSCIGVTAGTNLKVILEKIDEKLCSLVPFDFSSYAISCLNSPTPILTFKNFAEKVASDLCTVKSNIVNLQNNINILTTTVNNINTPQIIDGCSIGILLTDNIKQILQKIVNKICSLNVTNVDNSPSIVTTNSNSITFVTSGTKNHNITAAVNISTDSGNNIQSRANGLFVPLPPTAVPQTLSFNPTSRVLGISGGNTITLPPDLDNQILSLDNINKILSISGGNSVDFTPILSSIAVSQTPITANNTNSINFTASGTANHVISASVRVDNTQPNGLSLNSNGLFVTPETPITKIDSNTLILTLSGTNGHIIRGDVKVDTTNPNVLLVSSDGIRVDPSAISVVSTENGINNSTGPIKLGGNIVENTLLNDVGNNYHFAIKAKTFTFGNNVDSYYPLDNLNGIFRVVNSVENSSTISSTNFLNGFEIDLNNPVPSGNVMTSNFNSLQLNVLTNTTIPNSSIVSSNLNLTVIDALNNNIVLTDGVGPYGAELRSVSGSYNQITLQPQFSSNTASINNVATLVAASPYYLPSASNFPTITNFYGLLINSSNTFNNTNITNRYGIYQQGEADINVFRGSTQVRQLSLGTGSTVANTVSSSVDNVVTNKIAINVNGTTYYLLATTSNT
ncbi:tail fiber protein [Leptolyngbya phage Lbo-JY46]